MHDAIGVWVYVREGQNRRHRELLYLLTQGTHAVAPLSVIAMLAKPSFGMVKGSPEVPTDHLSFAIQISNVLVRPRRFVAPRGGRREALGGYAHSVGVA